MSGSQPTPPILAPREQTNPDKPKQKEYPLHSAVYWTAGSLPLGVLNAILFPAVRPYITDILAALGALATVAIAVLGYLQWRTFQQQKIAMDRQEEALRDTITK